MRTEHVTTLKRQATDSMDQLKKKRESRMTTIEGIARGEKAIAEGRSLTHKQAKQRMSRWLK